MIKFETFEHRFRKMIDYWGEAAFSVAYKERAMIRTRDLTPAETNKLIEFLIDNCERAPSIVKLVSFTAFIKARRPKYGTQDGLIHACSKCDGDGHFSAVKTWEGRPYFYAFRCPDENCQHAQRNVPAHVPMWSDSFRPEYVPRSEWKPPATPQRDVTFTNPENLIETLAKQKSLSAPEASP